MEPNLQAALGSFDVGFGPMSPDADIIRTGRVPVSAYLSAERFEAEREIFRRVWLNIAVDSEAPKPGDWIVRDVEAASASVLIVRGQDGKLRAFHNVCSHRAMKLVTAEKGCDRRFVCRYHAWSYGADGSLLAIPDRESFPDVDQAASGLTPIALEIWKGLVFVNLDPHPRQTLTEFLGGVVGLLEDAPINGFRYAARMTGVVKSNWKAGLDAASEAYHVPVLHRQSAGGMVSPSDNPHAHFLAIDFYGAHRRLSNTRNLDYEISKSRPIQKLMFESVPQVAVASDDPSLSFNLGGLNPTQAEEWGNDLVAIFPNFQLSLAQNGFWTMHYWPITIDSFRWEAHYHYRDPPKTWRERFAMEGSIAFYRDISTEDTACTQEQQIVMASGAKPYVQFGLYELLCRHEAAVIAAIVNRRDEPAIAIAAE
jgi:phenylpropionate dioxygenase-like ring-hydroxylating dioxygenase large terminal subunit